MALIHRANTLEVQGSPMSKPPCPIPKEFAQTANALLVSPQSLKEGSRKDTLWPGGTAHRFGCQHERQR